VQRNFTAVQSNIAAIINGLRWYFFFLVTYLFFNRFPGSRGPAGQVGPKGDKSDTGLQGLKGDAGEIGPRGMQGECGPMGFNASNSPIERVMALEHRMTSGMSQQNNYSLLASFAPSPGVSVVGNSSLVFGNTASLGSLVTFSVVESGNECVPSFVTVNVGDNVTWSWTSNPSVIEVQPTNASVKVAGGTMSGVATTNGALSQQMLVPGMRVFRNRRSGKLMTVETIGFGITRENLVARSQFLETL
jgi:hypothetical protein